MKIYGDFTAQQYCIDLNYSPLFNFTENDFVITGPGSLRGLNWIMEGATGKSTIMWGRLSGCKSTSWKMLPNYVKT